jgi:hypothetical protein
LSADSSPKATLVVHRANDQNAVSRMFDGVSFDELAEGSEQAAQTVLGHLARSLQVRVE